MQFAYPQARPYLMLAFAVAMLAGVGLVRKRRALLRLAQQGIHQPGMLVRPGMQVLRCALLALAAVLLGIAALGPQWGWTEEEIRPRGGRDVLIVLDVSRSMLAEDVAPNRLERAKADLRDLAGFLERAGGYRIGLVAFAERAAVMCPLTSDFRCFVEELADASLKSLRLRGHADWGDGTQIRLALERANQTIDDANAAYTDVLLVSDGEDMTHETVATAESLARRGVAAHAYGLGDSTHGALIPVHDSLGRPTHLLYRGEPVRTHLQEAVLRTIAETTHGRYFAAATSYRDLDCQLGELLAAKEKLDRQTVHRQRRGIHRYAWFVTPALLLLLLHGLLSDSRRPGRTVLEPPHYFSWVRSRQSPSLKRKRSSALRLRFRLGLCVFLCVLCDSVVSSSPPGDPRDTFQRGNELLRQAQQAGMNADPATLLQAQRQYQACLACQAAASNTGSLFENAHHNLEMTKLLLMQLGPASAAVEKTDGSDARSNDSRHESNESSAVKRSQDPGGGRQPTENDSTRGADAPRSERPEAASNPQTKQQQSQNKSESCSTCLTGQNQSPNGRKKQEGAQGSSSGKEVQSPSGQNPGRRSDKARSTVDANSSQGRDPGSAPSDRLGEDPRHGRGRKSGPKDEARGLFHAETPGVNQNQSRSQRNAPGQPIGIDSMKEKMPDTVDRVRKAAELRLQGAIQRIEQRRSRSGNGPETGPEDAANQNRYRDW